MGQDPAIFENTPLFAYACKYNTKRERLHMQSARGIVAAKGGESAMNRRGMIDAAALAPASPAFEAMAPEL
jgi:hypothetical protein